MVAMQSAFKSTTIFPLSPMLIHQCQSWELWDLKYSCLEVSLKSVFRIFNIFENNFGFNHKSKIIFKGEFSVKFNQAFFSFNFFLKISFVAKISIYYSGGLGRCVHLKGLHLEIADNPFNTKANFIQSTRTQRFLKTNLTLPCWFSFDSSRWVLSYMITHVPGFQSLVKLVTSSIRATKPSWRIFLPLTTSLLDIRRL